MTDALTGNSMMPTHPGIVAQQIADGAQQVAPIASGAPPIAAAVAPPPAESYDFWSGVEKQIAPQPEPPVQQFQLPEQPVAPVAQPPAVPAVQPQVPEQAVPVAPVQPGVPVQPQVQAPAAPPALLPEQQAAITEAGAAEQVIQPAAPQAPPQQAPAQDFSAFEAQTIEHLAKTEYALPQDVADSLVSRPEEVYPRLAARLHVRLASQIGKAVQDFLPSVIDQIVTAKIEANRLENDFFRDYPQLSDQRFRPVVAQSMRMARQASPNGTRAQIMSDGAALAAMKLRIQPQVVAQQPVAVQTPQVNGQQPVYQQPVAPFQPAVGSGAGLPTPQATVQNEFEALAMDQNW